MSETAPKRQTYLLRLFTSLLLPVALFLFISFSSSVLASSQLKRPVLTFTDNQLQVSTTLEEPFPEELMKTLLSGKAVRFSFYIQLYRDRFFLLSDVQIWKQKIERVVNYNNATREFSVKLLDSREQNVKFTLSPDEMKSAVSSLVCNIPSVIERDMLDKEHYFRLWVETDVSPLPGSYITDTMYSRKFIPSRLFAQ